MECCKAHHDDRDVEEAVQRHQAQQGQQYRNEPLSEERGHGDVLVTRQGDVAVGAADVDEAVQRDVQRAVQRRQEKAISQFETDSLKDGTGVMVDAVDVHGFVHCTDEGVRQ